MDSVVLKAMGKTISKAVSIAEILKKRFPLHQITEIGSNEIDETFIPVVEGLEEIKQTKRVSSIQITLSMTPLDSHALGYQAPLLTDKLPPSNRPRPQFHPGRNAGPNSGRGGFVNRRGGRGGRGRFNPINQQMGMQQQFQNYGDVDMRNRNPRPQGPGQNYPAPVMNQTSMEFPAQNFQGNRQQNYNQPQMNQNYNQGFNQNQGSYPNQPSYNNQGSYGNQGNFNPGNYSNQGYANQPHYTQPINHDNGQNNMPRTQKNPQHQQRFHNQNQFSQPQGGFQGHPIPQNMQGGWNQQGGFQNQDNFGEQSQGPAGPRGIRGGRGGRGRGGMRRGNFNNNMNNNYDGNQ